MFGPEILHQTAFFFKVPGLGRDNKKLSKQHKIHHPPTHLKVQIFEQKNHKFQKTHHEPGEFFPSEFSMFSHDLLPRCFRWSPSEQCRNRRSPGFAKGRWQRETFLFWRWFFGVETLIPVKTFRFWIFQRGTEMKWLRLWKLKTAVTNKEVMGWEETNFKQTTSPLEVHKKSWNWL